MLKQLKFKIQRVNRPWALWARFADYTLSFLIYRGSKKSLAKNYSKYLQGESSPEKISELIIGSNFLTRGKQRHSLVSQADYNYDSTIYNNLETVFENFDTDWCVNQLKENGFCTLPVLLPQDLQESLIATAKNSQVVPTKYALDQSPQNQPSIAIDHIWDVPFSTTIKNPAVQRVIQDKQLIEIAAKYLKLNPVIIGARLYWSLAHSNKEFLTAENWHVDAGDGLSFVKVFFALSDIGSENGPTGFIRNTHKSLPRKFYSGRRFHESEIRKRFGNDVMEATGVQGTVYMVDTRGLHRGTPVKKDHRLLFHFLYGSDFFGFERPTVFGSNKADCFGDKFSGELSRTFAAFRSDSPRNTSQIKGP